jgi:hypothetical protein
MTPVEPKAGRSRTTWLAVALLAALAYVRAGLVAGEDAGRKPST